MTEIQIPKRPEITDEIVRAAAIELLNEFNEDASGADDIVRHYAHWMDGYRLAKEMDTQCYWDVDESTVEMLGSLPNKVECLLEQAKKTWADTHNIQPKLAAGTVIKRGIIVDVYQHAAASYKVKKHGEARANVFLIVAFEEAEAEVSGS